MFSSKSSLWIGTIRETTSLVLLSRMHVFSTFCTGNSIFSSTIKKEALKPFIRTLFLPGAQLKSCHHLCKMVSLPVYHYYIPAHSNSSWHYIIFHATYYYIDYIRSFNSLSHLPSLHWVFTAFLLLPKLASYPQLLFKDISCIQKLNAIQTKNLLFKMTYAKTSKVYFLD